MSTLFLRSSRPKPPRMSTTPSTCGLTYVPEFAARHAGQADARTPCKQTFDDGTNRAACESTLSAPSRFVAELPGLFHS